MSSRACFDEGLAPHICNVWEGDAFELMADVDDASIDLLITSPPYWGLRSYGLPHDEDTLSRWTASGCTPERAPHYDWYRTAGGQLGLEPYPHWYVSHLVELFARARRVLKPSGSLWINLGDTYFARWSSIRDSGRQGFAVDRGRRRTPSGGHLVDKQLLLLPARFAIAMQESGWILRNDLIWSKRHILPRPEKDRLRASHEHFFHFVLRPTKGRANYFYDITECEIGARDVVEVEPSSSDQSHTATFPPELIRPRILSSSPPGGLVLDPFCGTGRALVEAVSSGRRAMGFELSRKHAKTAQANVSAAGREAESSEVSMIATAGQAARRGKRNR